MRSHEWIDQRSLALDRRIADKLEAEPELLQQAVRVLERWIAQRQPDPPPVLLEWRGILRHRSPPDILDMLRGDTEEARPLRQASPVCGIFSAGGRLAGFRGD